MDWFKSYMSSSVGRKQIMGITGLMLCGFLLMHLLGNFSLFLGTGEAGALDPSQISFNKYAHTLASMGTLLYVVEIILLSIFASHIALGVSLVMKNEEAGGAGRYVFSADAGDISLASRTMPYTGLAILVFLVVHLINFKFFPIDHENLYQTVKTAFESKLYAVYYIFTFAAVGLHVSHGFQSAFQSLGISHCKYTPCIKTLSFLYGLIIFVGYSSIPLYFILKQGSAA